MESLESRAGVVVISGVFYGLNMRRVSRLAFSQGLISHRNWKIAWLLLYIARNGSVFHLEK